MQLGPLHAHPYAPKAMTVPIGKQPWQRHIANIKAAFMAPPIVKQQGQGSLREHAGKAITCWPTEITFFGKITKF